MDPNPFLASESSVQPHDFDKFLIWKRIVKLRRQRQQNLHRRHMNLIGMFCLSYIEEQNKFLIQSHLSWPFSPRFVCHPRHRAVSPDFSADEGKEPKFWEHTVANYTDAEWLETFRVSRQTFQWLCIQLEDSLKPNGTSVPLKNLIVLEKRIAMSLYTLASGADYRIVADIFGVSRTSVCKFMKRFAEAVVAKLSTILLALPKSASYDNIRRSFQVASNMPPLVVGCLGFSEISVSPITDDVSLFINEAGNTTIILQALIDERMLFRKVCIEAKRPTLFLKRPNELTKMTHKLVEDRYLPSFVVCPTEYYPLRPWLMRQYAQPVSSQQKDFNEAVEKVLAIKDNAFRRLYARWKVLQRKCDLEPKTMEVIATACCALHNLVEGTEDGYVEEWANNVDTSKFTVGHFKRPRHVKDSHDAIDMRDFLSQIISSKKN